MNIRTFKKLVLLVSVPILTSACAVPVKGGRVYIFGGPPIVVVTNNMKVPCELTGNGAHLTDLKTGQTYNVEMSYSIDRNTILACKASNLTPHGKSIYLGQASANFRGNSGYNDRQEWVIYSYQPIR